MRRRLAAKLAGAPVPAELTGNAAQALRQPDASFDAVVFTQVLCTVTDLDQALAEARRVLRPGGQLIVLEHVRGSGSLARWQDRLTPLWSRLIPGCHLGRDTAAAIERAGFTIQRSELFDPYPRWGPGQADAAGHRHTHHLRSDRHARRPAGDCESKTPGRTLASSVPALGPGLRPEGSYSFQAVWLH